jgi:hypothetical protein
MESRGAVRLAHRLARGENAARRLVEAGRAALGAALGPALRPDERATLGLRLYADALGPHPEAEGEPFPWERAWWAADLPPAPATLLVGGAGAGREVQALSEAGYAIWAWDPVPAAAAALSRRLGPENAACARHEDTDRWPGPPRVDAVLFGWGSLTHVLDAEARARVIAAADARTDGPILASVWTREAFPPPTGRAAALGARVGGIVGRLRGIAPDEDADALGYAPWCGFGHRFEPRELEALGRTVGRSTDFRAGPYPHVTWRRAPRRSPG